MKTKTDCGCEKDVFDCWAQGDPQHMPTPLKVTFDGMGLNDANDPYRERMATFTPKYRDQGKRIELAVNAHEELLRAMRKAVKDIEYAMDCKTFAPSSGIPMENAKVVLELAIAKAEGK